MSFDSVNAPFGSAPAPFGYDPTPRPRYLGYAGFVTTPACWDDVIQQFLAVAPLRNSTPMPTGLGEPFPLRPGSKIQLP